MYKRQVYTLAAASDVPVCPPKWCTYLQLRAVSKSTIQVEISSVASNMGPVTSYYIIVGSVALSEQERVDAGIASSPAGYWKGKPVLTSGYRLASSATMRLQVNTYDDHF